MAKPKKCFKSGGVRALIWENERKTNDGVFTVESVTFSRRYKTSGGQWDSTCSFRKNDLPKLEVVLRQAYEFLNAKKTLQSAAGKPKNEPGRSPVAQGPGGKGRSEAKASGAAEEVATT